MRYDACRQHVKADGGAERFLALKDGLKIVVESLLTHQLGAGQPYRSCRQYRSFINDPLASAQNCWWSSRFVRHLRSTV
jgi:hypothetical protein